ncbi:NifU family protein [Nocardia jiangxiensis]|uniref:NifU family protein n=1 Tax=Nocardia jiangxiensis TaxID=282685 RepID=A0ABW6RUB6_9NOCA|nr:NifU family protein [Nocardia jiangxiensis]
MADTVDVIREVIGLLEPMVAPDGGSIRLAEFAAEKSRLTVDYLRGSNDACSTCVLDGESLKAFIEEGLQTRGIQLTEVIVSESTPA